MTDSKFSEVMTPEFIRTAITVGKFDTALDDLARTIEARRQMLAIEYAATLSVGDEITVISNVRPKLLAGARCQITGFDGDKVKVKLLVHRSSKWSLGSTVTLPRTLIERG